MNKFKFSPVKYKEELFRAIEYIHFACFELTKRVFDRYLPVSGNLGVFSHFDDEFESLTKIRRELTDENTNWNQKYYLLHEPITIAPKIDVPETTYTFLYTRKPDTGKPQVGDIDIVLDKKEFENLKKQSLDKKEINGVELFYRPDLDMIRLSAPDIDALPYITTKYMSENVNIPNIKNEK